MKKLVYKQLAWVQSTKAGSMFKECLAGSRRWFPDILIAPVQENFMQVNRSEDCSSSPAASSPWEGTRRRA